MPCAHVVLRALTPTIGEIHLPIKEKTDKTLLRGRMRAAKVHRAPVSLFRKFWRKKFFERGVAGFEPLAPALPERGREGPKQFLDRFYSSGRTCSSRKRLEASRISMPTIRSPSPMSRMLSSDCSWLITC